MKTDILAFGAHPDDVELCCSGTIAKHIAAGKKAGLIDLTKGELGTRGNATTRANEAAKAAKILGISFRENLNLPDGFIRNEKESQMAVVKIIRKYQPEIVFANAPTDRHPDHGRAARIVADSCFLSGLVKIETTVNGKKQKAFRPRLVLHYIQDRILTPDVLVDISDFMDVRMKCIKAYGSQFYDERSKEPETPISSKQFLESLYFRPLEWGRMIGVKYAEGFVCERSFGVKNIFDLI